MRARGVLGLVAGLCLFVTAPARADFDVDRPALAMDPGGRALAAWPSPLSLESATAARPKAASSESSNRGPDQSHAPAEPRGPPRGPTQEGVDGHPDYAAVFAPLLVDAAWELLTHPDLVATLRGWCVATVTNITPARLSRPALTTFEPHAPTVMRAYVEARSAGWRSATRRCSTPASTRLAPGS